MVGALPPARPVRDDDREEVLLPVVSGVKELLFAPVNPFNNRAGFVAGPAPETGLGQAVQAVTRLNCRLWASRDKTGYSNRVNQYNGEVCGPYLDGIGENPTAGSVGPPFRGGQCFGGQYNFTFTATDANGVRQSSQRNTNGRLVGAGQITLSNGNKQGGYYRQLNPTAPIDFVPIQTVGPTQDSNPVISNVQPVGSTPNNCGDPPTEVRPPATVTPVTPIVPTFPINLPGVGPININIDLDPTGAPVICAPDVQTCITINPDFGDDPSEPGGGGGGGSGGGDEPPPGDVGTPGFSEPTGDGGDAEGTAPPGTVLTGLRLDLIGDPPREREYAPGVYRGGAYIYMGVPAGLDQDFAGSMLSDGQFVFAEKTNLTKWKVRSNVGFNWSVTPYYRVVED